MLASVIQIGNSRGIKKLGKLSSNKIVEVKNVINEMPLLIHVSINIV